MVYFSVIISIFMSIDTLGEANMIDVITRMYVMRESVLPKREEDEKMWQCFIYFFIIFNSIAFKMCSFFSCLLSFFFMEENIFGIFRL